MRALRAALWAAVAGLGALAFAAIAVHRTEPVSASSLVVAAVCTWTLAYRFYSRFIAAKVLALDDAHLTPAVRHADGRDFVPTNRWVVFGHHFAAIAGPGPLIGPVLAAQFGYLPGTIWILAGVVLGGAVQDFVILVASVRRDGRSLAKLARDYLGPVGAFAGTLGILLIMVILIAVLGLVVVNALAESPWGTFTVAMTIPIAMVMGVLMRGGHGREVRVATAVGLVLLVLALLGGHWVSSHPQLGPAFTLARLPLALLVIAYGLSASILPVWLLLAPRDYLSTFVKLGTVALLGVGILAVRPDLRLPALTRYADGEGPIFGGGIFPFCFITIACGAISGFHSLIASGTTPKLLKRETDARMIGYGAMLLESFVAIMAMVAASSLPPGQYFAINTARPLEWISEQGFPVTEAEMASLAERVGERTVQGRTGGAPCLAVGMAEIFQRFLGGPGVAALWYHFALMFEALFILTTVDAGTRVARFLLQEFGGLVYAPLARRSWLPGNLITSALVVTAWAGLIFSGSISSIWPMFGVTNQLLAAIALGIGTTLLLKAGKARYVWVTAVPMAFMFATTLTASWELLGMFWTKAGHAAAAGEALTWRIDAFLVLLMALLALVVLADMGWRWWANAAHPGPESGPGPGAPPAADEALKYLSD